MSEYTVTPVPHEYLPGVWNDLARMLAPAIDTAKGRLVTSDLYLEIIDGTYVPWIVLQDGEPVAAFTTRVLPYPQRKALVVDWVGGQRMNRWIDAAIGVIKAQAEANDCQHIEGYGRLAWGRVLKRHGFEPEYTAYRMELGNG
jgi:hypothetical protein